MQRFVPIEDLFKGRHFDEQIIILCVAWYTSFKLSLRDLVIMMADRGISVTHTTILRWVQRYVPEFEKLDDDSARDKPQEYVLNTSLILRRSTALAPPIVRKKRTRR